MCARFLFRYWTGREARIIGRKLPNLLAFQEKSSFVMIRTDIQTRLDSEIQDAGYAEAVCYEKEKQDNSDNTGRCRTETKTV